MASRHVYRVRWRRHGWSTNTHDAQRIFLTRRGADNLVARISRQDASRLAIGWLNVDRIALRGGWVPVPDAEPRSYK